MALMKYWFSARQKRMRDALNGDVTVVKVGDQYLEYTQVLNAKEQPKVWPDFVLVAEGEGLECKSISNADGDSLGILNGSGVTAGV